MRETTVVVVVLAVEVVDVPLTPPLVVGVVDLVFRVADGVAEGVGVATGVANGSRVGRGVYVSVVALGDGDTEGEGLNKEILGLINWHPPANKAALIIRNVRVIDLAIIIISRAGNKYSYGPL